MERFDACKETKRMEGYFQRLQNAEQHGQTIESWRRHKILKKVGASGLILTALISLGAKNIADNRAEDARTHTSVSSISAAHDPLNNDTAIVFLNGFATNNGDNLVGSLTGAVQQVTDGEAWSVRYGSSLDTQDTVDAILSLAKVRHKTSLVLAGYSTGGTKAVAVADEIMHQSAVEVKMIDLFSSPSGVNDERPASRAGADAFVNVVDTVPGIAYWDPFRFVGEMVVRAGRYTHEPDVPTTVTKFFDTANDVVNNIDGADVPSVPLMYDQLLAIKDARIDDHFKSIASTSYPQLMPVIAYFGTPPSGYDTNVNDVQSANTYCRLAENSHLPCYSYGVPGLVHGVPELSVDQYKEAFKKAAAELQATLAHQEYVYNTAAIHHKLYFE